MAKGKADGPSREGRTSLESQLAELEQLYQKAPIGLCLVDRDLKFVRINEGLAAMIGVAEAAHLGKEIGKVLPELANQLEPSCRKVLDTGRPLLDLVVHGTTPAEPALKQYWLVRYYPHRTEGGAVGGVSLIVQDITERRMAEQRLQNQMQFSEQVIESLPGFFFMVDEKGTLVRWNKTREDLLDHAPEELEGMSVEEIVGPDEGPRIGEAIQVAFREGSANLEFCKVTGDGRRIFCLGTGVRASIGGTDYLLGMVLNITERKQMEEALQRAFTEIKELKEQLEAENVYLREEIKTVHNHEDIVGNSEAIRNVLVQSEQVAATDSTVLIQGETGTGKELLARIIHEHSSRKDRAMVKVNCAAMPSTLVESELFGREKGAYTGALTKQIGRFELADNSTIFLDEIGELSPEVQAKLLRVLQEGQFERLGSPETISVDARIVTATNRDLAQAVKEGEFREDLYYRLNVFPILVPPLRKRREDIPPLVWSFVKEFGKRMGKIVETVSKKDMEALQRYPWPGNIRELRNVIERAMILAQGPTLRIELPQEPGGGPAVQDMTMEEVERSHILQVLEMTDWRVRGEQGAARTLGLKPTTLEARMRKLGIKRQR